MKKPISREEMENITKLGENEYLLSIDDFDNTGFLTKLNKTNGKIPKKFLDWRGEKFFIFVDTFQENWKVAGYRNGTSVCWVVLEHPERFTIEVSIKYFVENIIPNAIIENGYIKNPMKWNNGLPEIKKIRSKNGV